MERLQESEFQHNLSEMMHKEILKNTFHYKAETFIDSLIRQRELLVRKRSSLKNDYAMLSTIDTLRRNLEAFKGKDRPMATLFLHHQEIIRSLIPGDYPNKRYDTFSRLREQAREITNRQLSLL